MEQQGWKLLPDSLQYNRAGHGLDMAFQQGERFAIAEAKHGRGLSSLATDSQGLRQGGMDYIENRLGRLLQTQQSQGLDTSLTRKLLNAYDTGNLESYAGFYRGDKLYQLNFSGDYWKFTSGGATLVR